MRFKNVKVPEGINVSRHSPLADLFILSGGAVLLFGALGLAALLLGGALARHLPVSWESSLADAVIGGLEPLDDETDSQIAAELQTLAGRLEANMALPEGLQITVHYLDSKEVNAFATLGGHVFLFRGLIERMASENTLAMVLAHEIAHAANRDPAAAMGGALLLQLVLAATLGSAPDSLEGLILGPNALLALGFSREAERDADRDALFAIVALYGHTAGAAEIFEIFLEEAAGAGAAEPPALLSTHPLSAERIADIRAMAREHGWALDGEATPLPPAIAKLHGDP
jgi:predicted Zn-dependent protease